MISFWMGNRYTLQNWWQHSVWWPASRGAGSSAWTQELITNRFVHGQRWLSLGADTDGFVRGVKWCQALGEIFPKKGKVW